MKIAIPCAEGKLCMHFGHCEQFAIINVDDNGNITDKEMVTPPPHEPGLLPKWLGERNVTQVVAGGMGVRAQQLFNQAGVEVVTGAPALEPEEIVRQFTGGTLQTGANACDH